MSSLQVALFFLEEDKPTIFFLYKQK